MYDAILYPTDGSDGSEAAFDHVRALASRFDATVHVFYAIDEGTVGLEGAAGQDHDDSPGLGAAQPETSPGLGKSHLRAEEFREQLAENGEAFVENTAERLADVATVTAVRHGNPHEAILEYAEGNDIDVVVMGTHGKTGVERYLLGSVTEKVVRLSDVPVVTVRGDEAGP